MKYQYQLSASDGESVTNAFWFNHKFMGWITLPKEEMQNLLKILKARYRKGSL